MIVECPGCRVRYDLSGRRVGSRVRCRCGTGFAVPRPALEAGVLQCAACGAPCAPDDSACSYCQAVLAVVACPRCFGRVFPGAEHCQHCGAELLVGARPDPALMPVRKCPRCAAGNELVPRLVADTLLDECHGCGGVWVQSKVFESLVKNRDQQARLEAAGVAEITIDEPRASPASKAPASRSSREYIPCPDCRQLMNRKNFGNVSGVLIDVCKSHGIWFDTGELGRVVRFVMRGGLAETRKRESEGRDREAREKRVNALVLTEPNDLIEPVDRSDWVEQFVRLVFRLLQ